MPPAEAGRLVSSFSGAEPVDLSSAHALQSDITAECKETWDLATNVSVGLL